MPIKRLIQSSLSGGCNEDERVLRKPAVIVKEIDNKVEMIIQDLRDTIWAYPICRGLSANQIGYPFAITVVNLSHDTHENDLILINPCIEKISGKKEKKIESCMSLWGKQGEVERRDKVQIRYYNVNMEEHLINASGMMSRILQHEIDHLNGILYVDKLVPGKKLEKACFFDDYQIIDSNK